MATNTEYMLQAESVIKQYRQSESVITAVNRANIKIEKMYKSHLMLGLIY